MGKGWAKGLTAKTDPRAARQAEAHRGMKYVRRTPTDSPTRKPFYQLQYGKLASHVLLPLLYPSPDAPCLERKRAIW